MTATQTLPRRTTAPKTEMTNSRPVTKTLLELAYLMHATKVVAVREAPCPRPPGSI